MSSFYRILFGRWDDARIAKSRQALVQSGHWRICSEEHASKTDLSARVVHDLRNILGMDFGQMERLSWSRSRRKTLV